MMRWRFQSIWVIQGAVPPTKTATYQEDGVIYTVRADEGEDLMDFVSNLDSKPKKRRILLKMSIPTLRQIMQEKC